MQVSLQERTLPMNPQAPARVALVTGASRGIGRSIAQALAARGLRVAVHYHRGQADAQATLDLLAGSGHQAYGADLSDSGATRELWAHVSGEFGEIDVVVNNAGIFIDHPPLTTDYERWLSAWQRTLNANLRGPANLSLLAAQAMTARAPRPGGNFGRGRIVNISSRGAFRGEPDAPAYGASKAGLNSLSQSLAKALAPHQVYVYCIAPGWVETDMALGHVNGPDGASILAQHPLGRIARPGEVADAAVFCAMDAPPAMTGSILDVNGASYLRT
jgi:NAD(P)-dependent dehydrogenase (short-subunit alcohol dehydrogenase family)